MHTKVPQRRCSPATLTTWLMCLKGSPIPLLMKWRIKELKGKNTRYFAAFGMNFMVRWIDHRHYYWAIQILNGSEPAQAIFGFDSALYIPLKFASSVFSYLSFFPSLIPSFPWSVPGTFLFPSFNIHHPENWFESNVQPVPVSMVGVLLHSVSQSTLLRLQERSRWNCSPQNTMLCTFITQPHIFSSLGSILPLEQTVSHSSRAASQKRIWCRYHGVSS